MSTQVKVSPIKEFAKLNGFTAVSNIRVNKNGYLYATFENTSDPNNRITENIYFSKATSRNFGVGDQPKSFAGLSISEYPNDEGVMMRKISGSAEYTSIDELFA